MTLLSKVGLKSKTALAEAVAQERGQRPFSFDMVLGFAVLYHVIGQFHSYFALA